MSMSRLDARGHSMSFFTPRSSLGRQTAVLLVASVLGVAASAPGAAQVHERRNQRHENYANAMVQLVNDPAAVPQNTPGVCGIPSGRTNAEGGEFLVYENQFPGSPFTFARPGANVQMGDDLLFDFGTQTGLRLVRYDHICVYSQPGTPNYNVTMQLWTSAMDRNRWHPSRERRAWPRISRRAPPGTPRPPRIATSPPTTSSSPAAPGSWCNSPPLKRGKSSPRWPNSAAPPI